ncbi:MAG: hypothetical protein FJZ01_24120 [Candidatus Sericytochromatia bacterium]|nr:hypothetical protein [Candidatus Tanganyikabacteria bacterium]
MAETPPYPGAPRWVKILLIVLLGAASLLVAVKLSGHGPPAGNHGVPGDREAPAGERVPAAPPN